ncbi:MAG: acetyl-CoA carboxylase, biotin carboxyl carrier protein [Acidobacteria bacterium RIFCSPLOWO2_12_FULL_67_14b]|nr:MAG: acetyl-CoA carboxylase, biotin carboxyl carrier protein [Acidobacteria bacterium RIFCSPLOWO2_12_FULL_67_14b]
MTLDEIKQLIEFIKAHDLSEFELEHDGVKVRIKSGSNHHMAAPHLPPSMPVLSPPAAAPAAAPGASAAVAAAEEGGELAIVKSPIVGTFYRAAEPGAKPFVSVGDTVRKGQVLCIIEAMKLMNEIDSEYDGEVTSVYVENGQAVQYGERLFAIRPTT